MYLKKRRRKVVDDSFNPETIVPKALESSYQEDLVRLLFQNKPFLSKICLYLEPDKHFDFSHLQWLSRKIIDYYNIYKISPTVRSLSTVLETGKNAGEVEDNLFTTIKDFLNVISLPVEDERFVIDTIRNWIVYQVRMNALIQGVKAAEKGDLREMQEAFVKGSSVHLNFGLKSESYVESTENALEQRKAVNNEVVPSGLPLDSYTQYGGIPKQHVCVVLAATNVGKTSALVHIGTSAVEAGHKVAHIVLESPKEELRLRYDSAFCDMPMHMIPTNDWLVKETALKMKEKHGDPLHYERFSPGALTPVRVRAWLDQLIANGNRPDLLIIDSADDMIPSRGSSDKHYEDMDKVYLGLIQIAEEYNLVLWTSSQANRDAMEADIVTLRMVGDSLKKVQRASFVVALCQTFQESICVPTQGRLYLAKNRWGRKNVTEKVYFSWAKQRIEPMVAVANVSTNN